MDIIVRYVTSLERRKKIWKMKNVNKTEKTGMTKNSTTYQESSLNKSKEKYIHRLRLPVFESDDFTFKTFSGLIVATGYNRIVIGLRGPYVEFSKEYIVKGSFHIPEEERWRVSSKTAYYVEYRSNCDSNVMLYHQKRLVDYADYKIGMYYISPFDLTDENSSKLIERKEND